MNELLEECPICKRKDVEHWDKHHLIPKLKGGKNGETVNICRMCHDKIHSIFSEAELANYYNTIEKIMENEDVQKFAKWLSKKPSNFYDGSKMSVRLKRKKNYIYR